jgi:hypothetical protein
MGPFEESFDSTPKSGRALADEACSIRIDSETIR